jgi:hypothetical protein
MWGVCTGLGDISLMSFLCGGSVWNSMGWCDSFLIYFRGLEYLWFGVIHFTVGFVG